MNVWLPQIQTILIFFRAPPLALCQWGDECLATVGKFSRAILNLRKPYVLIGQDKAALFLVGGAELFLVFGSLCLLGGMLSGLFILGIFTRSATGAGAIAGALISAATLFTIRWYQPLQVFAYAPIGLLTCVSSGWLLSFVLPSRRKDVTGLTYFDMNR